MLATVALALLAPLAGLGQGTALDVKASGKKTFHVNSRAGNCQVSVFSQSTLEDFTTVCNRVSGQFQLDPRNLEAFAGKFTLRVEDMRTGIELRDQHLRGADWLDAAKHPEIVMEFTKAEAAKRQDANSAAMKLVGTCTLRGKTNPVSIPAIVTYLDESPATMKLVKGDVVRIRADFELKLSDYGITGPAGSEIIGMKVSDVQTLKVAVFGATEAPPADLQVDREKPSSAPAVKPPPPKKSP